MKKMTGMIIGWVWCFLSFSVQANAVMDWGSSTSGSMEIPVIFSLFRNAHEEPVSASKDSSLGTSQVRSGDTECLVGKHWNTCASCSGNVHGFEARTDPRANEELAEHLTSGR